ncbi:nucleoprotein-like protein NP, partial [Syngnathus scovelli chapparvovirus]
QLTDRCGNSSQRKKPQSLTAASITGAETPSLATRLQERLQQIVDLHQQLARPIDVALRVAGQPGYNPAPVTSALQAAGGALSQVDPAIQLGNTLLQEAKNLFNDLISPLTGLLGGTTTTDEAATSLSRIQGAPTPQDLQASVAPQLTEGGYLNTDPSQPQHAEQIPSTSSQTLLSPSSDVLMTDILDLNSEEDQLIRRLVKNSHTLLPNSFAKLTGGIQLKLKQPVEWAGRLIPPV